MEAWYYSFSPDFAVEFMMNNRKAIQKSVWGNFSGETLLQYGAVEKYVHMQVCAAFEFCNNKSAAKSGFNAAALNEDKPWEK
ncbi:MAG TPA: hypothetical protein PKD90_15080 [Phnomibacter sp.]|nr:hypothetical protein [Phnomibacter sp.]